MLEQIDVKYFKLAVGLDSIGKVTDVDISARCPICSSDDRWKRSRRLHLYTKNGITNINCFSGDCSARNKTMYSFLRDLFPSLLTQYKKDNFSNTMESLAKGGDGDVFSSFKTEKLEDKPKPEILVDKPKEVVTQDLSPFMTNISEVPRALEYLENRGIKYDKSLYGKWCFGYQDLMIGDIMYKITDSIVIPLYYEGEMYGFYSRSIVGKDFSTYMQDCNFGFKVWNWFNVDKSKPVYIFEAIYDAISSGLPNCIALLGANIPSERLKELKEPVFVLDNDKSGFINSLEHCKKHKVYVQPILYPEKDMNALMLNHDINIPNLVKSNLFTGIMAKIKIESKL
jgi:hypothetical protein